VARPEWKEEAQQAIEVALADSFEAVFVKSWVILAELVTGGAGLDKQIVVFNSGADTSLVQSMGLMQYGMAVERDFILSGDDD
jgi:hypothetical protein